MENLAVEIAKYLELSSVPNLYDWAAYLGAGILALIALKNLTKEKTKKEKEEKPAIKVEKDLVSIPVAEKKKEEIEIKEEAPKEVPKLSWTKRLSLGLARTRTEVWGKVSSILSSSNISEEQYEEIEEILYTSDLSPGMVSELLDELQSKFKEGEEHPDFLHFIKNFLKSKMSNAQDKVNQELYTKNSEGTKVIMIVGVNGAGKTTTIGKLATKLKAQGASVVVGACDTFRAAAVEQLEVWCKRAGVEIVKAAEGANPSGVAYDTVAIAKEKNADYCIIDTAGRLHTASNLMDELAKTKKVMSKVISDAPHEVLLVVDAITGQNALRQAQEFHKALNLTGLIFTKCDGSSKAGSAVSIVKELDVPVVYIGVGEQVEDLNRFNLDEYLDALLGIQEA